MKRIITLLVVILISQSVTGQIAKKMNQEFETTKEATFSKIHKKAIKNAKSRNPQTNSSVLAFHRTGNGDSKTLDSLVIQAWDDNLNQLQPATREEFTYDANDRVENAIMSLWNSDTSSWQAFQNYEFAFDANGNLSSQLIYYQYYPNIWTLSKKIEYTYDSNNNAILEEEFDRDITNTIWFNSHKYEYTYDSNQNFILDIGYTWISGLNAWRNWYMDEFNYTNNILISQLNSLWNYGTDQWFYDKQILYTFIAGELITEVEQEWEGNNGWINHNKDDYTHNTNGSLDIHTLSIWNTYMSAWEFQYKDDYQYDGNGNRTLGNYFEWYGGDTGWIEYYKDEYIFDLDFSMTEIIAPFFYFGDFNDENTVVNNMIIGYLGFEYENMVWVDINKILFFYSNYNNPLGVDDYDLANALKVYPNPASNILVIESEIPIDRVELYSVLGKKVKDVRTGFKTIPIYDIADGLYLVKITSGNQSIKKKIIKQ